MNIINQGCRFDNERKLGENWMGMRGGEGQGWEGEVRKDARRLCGSRRNDNESK